MPPNGNKCSAIFFRFIILVSVLIASSILIVMEKKKKKQQQKNVQKSATNIQVDSFFAIIYLKELCRNPLQLDSIVCVFVCVCTRECSIHQTFYVLFNQLPID